MARWKITVSGKGVRKASVEKLVEKLKSQFGTEVTVTVEDASPPESRADRFSQAMDLVGDARSEFESLRDELQEWRDNMPENLQNSSKAQKLDDAIGDLDSLTSDIGNIEDVDVQFPGMR